MDWGCGWMWYKNDKSIFYPHNTEPFEFNIYGYLTPRIRKEVYKYLEEVGNPVVVNNICMQPCKCDKCGKITSKVSFEIVAPLKKTKNYIPKYYCSCHGTYKKSSPNQKHFYCHLCGTEMVQFSEIMWD
jgi:hypothetical protein